jgi:hypothetical protein
VRRDRVAARRAVLGVLAVLVILLVAFRAPLARGAVCAVLDLVSGDRVAMDGLTVSPTTLGVAGLAVERDGAPLLAARRVDVRYDLRRLLFGGGPRYGLSAVTLVRPRLTVIRHADGSFNLPVGPAASPGSNAGTSDAQRSAAPPLAFTLTVRGASVVLDDPFRALAPARSLSADGIDADAAIDSAAGSRYRGRGRLGGDPRQAFGFAGRVGPNGFALHRVRAARIVLAPIVDYFVNAPSAEILAGDARDLDVTAYAFPGERGAPVYHVAGSARIAGGAMRVPGLAVSADAMNGRLDVYDGGLAAPQLDAELGGIPVRLAGGLFGWHEPAFRLGILARADLGRVRELFRFSRRLPLAGIVAVSTLLEGSVGAPLVATRVAAARVTYGRFPVDEAGGRALYYASGVDVVGAHGTYGGIGVAVDGSIALGGPDVLTRLVVAARGPAAAVPYLAQIAPGATIGANALLAGTGLRFDARGFADGSGGGVTLAAPFHDDPSGDGTFGPAEAVRTDGARISGTFYLDRRENRSAFWVAARDYPFADLGTAPALPGIALRAPVFAGRLDGTLAGAGPPSAFRLAGRVGARDLRVGSVRIDAVAGDVAGAFGNLRLGGVSARGPWGAFTGGGAYAAGRLALAGTYGGSFARLRTFTGDLGGAGPVAGPVALLIDPSGVVVQVRGAASAGARVFGVPVDGIAGTIAVAAGRLQVFAATARVAGGDLSAAGTLDGARGIGVSLAGADVAQTAGFGAVRSGRAFAIGTLSRDRNRSRFEGGLALGGSRLDRLPVSANGTVSLEPGRLGFTDTSALAGTTVATLAGGVAGLARTPVFDVAVRLPSASLAPLARAFAGNGGGIAGTVTGDLRVRGSAGSFATEGRIAIPEGSFGGLAFSNGSATIALDRDGLRARDGSVTVGRTQTAFDASYRAGDAALRVDAPHADLADFNDLFDAGDTLGGRGRVAFRYVERDGATRTNANIAIAGLRYRRFELGDARAEWASSGRNVRGAVRFGGPSGRLAASGVLVLPATASRERILLRSRFDGTANLDGLDLGVWLPALGYQLPIDGRVDATATIVGPLVNPAVTTTATLRNGSIGKFPVDRFTISATTTLDRTTVRSLELELPSIAVVGNGNFGLADRSPIAFALHATSPNLGAVSTRLFGASYPLEGAAELDLTVDGTRANPRLAGRLDVRGATVHGVAIPAAHAAFDVRGRDVVLSDAGADFAKGAVTLDGSVPFEIAPFSFGPARAPVALTFAATDVELANFAPLLPVGSRLQGRVDGRVAIGGTAGAPRLAGRLVLGGASFQSPLETIPLTAGSAVLGFEGNAVRLDSLHASAGGGALDASGSTRLADLVHPGADATFDFVARADKLRLDLPAYGSGSLDGTLSYARIAGSKPTVAGDLRLSDGTIPFSALLLASGIGGAGDGFDAASVAPGGSGTSARASAPSRDVAFNLDVSALRNVRVRSANVDIGARGDLHVGGSLTAPELDGGFVSTGGTITYFNTVFRLLDGKVTFVKDAGLIPTLDAHAVTHVIDPDPNTVRNVQGTADVTLALAGPVTNLSIALSSDPSYERQQILGLLLGAPALGASNLFGENKDQATLYGSNATGNLAPGVAEFRSPTGELSVAQEAFGVANAQFTRTLLAPFETSFAQAVGLSNFNVNVDYTGSVGVSALRVHLRLSVPADVRLRTQAERRDGGAGHGLPDARGERAQFAHTGHLDHVGEQPQAQRDAALGRHGRIFALAPTTFLGSSRKTAFSRTSGRGGEPRGADKKKQAGRPVRSSLEGDRAKIYLPRLRCAGRSKDASTEYVLSSFSSRAPDVRDVRRVRRLRRSDEPVRSRFGGSRARRPGTARAGRYVRSRGPRGERAAGRQRRRLGQRPRADGQDPLGRAHPPGATVRRAARPRRPAEHLRSRLLLGPGAAAHPAAAGRNRDHLSRHREPRDRTHHVHRQRSRAVRHAARPDGHGRRPGAQHEHLPPRRPQDQLVLR